MTRPLSLLPAGSFTTAGGLTRTTQRPAGAGHPVPATRPSARLRPGPVELLEMLAGGRTTTEAVHALGLKVSDLKALLTAAGVRNGAGIPAALHTAYTTAVLDRPGPQPAPAGFSPGEILLWQAVATRSAPADVARAAGIPPGTVHRAVGRLRVRAGARTTAELIRLGHTFRVLPTGQNHS
ncbi:hypothetical protein [Streptomyces sp. NPDC001889]